MESSITQTVLTFLGGGFVGALINWFRTSRSEQILRYNKYTFDQLNNLYGPIYFLVCKNEVLANISDRYTKAIQKEILDVNWSPSEETRVQVRSDLKQSIDLSNYYIGLTHENNKEISDILQLQFQYINPEDIDVCKKYLDEFLRMEREFWQTDKLDAPLEIYESVGHIHFMRDDFASLIRNRFFEYQKIIKKYNKSS